MATCSADKTHYQLVQGCDNVITIIITMIFLTIMLIMMVSDAKKQIHVQDDDVCQVDFVSVLSVENTC